MYFLAGLNLILKISVMKKSPLMSFSIVAIVFVYLISGCKVIPAVTTISLDSARAQVNLFNERITSSTDSLRSAARLKSFLYKAEFFTKRDLQAILAQKGCTGIRVYHAIDGKGKAVTFIVGVSGSSDQLPKGTALATQPSTRRQNVADSTAADNHNATKAAILRSEVPCPEMCPEDGL